MRYTHLDNDNYIVYTSHGMRTVTRESLNFNKIKKSIQEGASDDEIAELLKPTPLPNGIYKAYLLVNENRIFLKHISLKGEVEWEDLMGNKIYMGEGAEQGLSLLGVYASLDAVIEDWAEYVL